MMKVEIEVDVLIVGGGMAADRLLRRLIDQQFPGKIAVVGREVELGYNRVLLPAFLAGEIKREALFSSSQHWRRAPNVAAFSQCEIVRVDLSANQAFSADRCFRFNQIVFANGSRVNYPDFEGSGIGGVSGVSALRSLGEAQALLRLPRSHILVLGGGLLGLEAADALNSNGHHVHVVHRGGHLMNRQLDPHTAGYLEERLRDKGIRVTCGATLTGVKGTVSVREGRLSDRSVEPIDLVLVATGVKPSTELAVRSGVNCGHGIIVDRRMQTAHKQAFAIGECAEIDGRTFSLIEAVDQQADVLASVIVNGTGEYVPEPYGTHLKVAGIDLYAIGETQGSQPGDLVIEDRAAGVCRRMFVQDKHLVGSVLYGDTRGSRQLSRQVGRLLNASQLESLAFGSSA